MKVALCCIAKNENKYFDEWILHHKNVGFDTVIIYDNNSETTVVRVDSIVINWKDDLHGSQSRAYLDCCNKYKDYFDYIAFLDVDEFYISKSMNVKYDISVLGNPDGIGIYWRIYGKPEPFLEKRQSVYSYKFYSENPHIKSIVNPKKVLEWKDPHKARLKKNSVYINEIGDRIISPIGLHTSVNMYIKHIFTRSKEEFFEKIERGDANLRVKNRTWEDFYNYNNSCVLKDE